MNTMMSIQEANIQRLNAINPNRVFVTAVDVEARLSCATDSQHGKGVCFLIAMDEQEPNVLCLKCAVEATELWLLDPEEFVTVAVAR